jgi:hypothetical protein
VQVPRLRTLRGVTHREHGCRAATGLDRRASPTMNGLRRSRQLAPLPLARKLPVVSVERRGQGVQREETRSLMSECHATNLNRRLPAFDHMTAVALAEMGLALGRPGRALKQLADVAAHGLGTADPLIRIQALPAFAAASARAAQRDQAATAAANFENWFTAAGSTPNLALLARIRALLAPDGAGDDNF